MTPIKFCSVLNYFVKIYIQKNRMKIVIISEHFTILMHSFSGVGAAKAGTLTFMVGGPQKEYAEVEVLLRAMGAKVVLCGGVGSGQAAKICNNMLLGKQFNICR